MRGFPRTILVSALLVAAATAALAEDRGLKPIYDFVVDVNGTVDKGWRILAAKEKNRLLLISPPGDQALLLAVTDKSVRPVDRLMMKNNPDGTIDILAGGVSATRIIPVVTSAMNASFTVDGRIITLKPRPPLLGIHSVQELVSDRPSFGEGIKTYQPEAAAVTYLKTYDKPTDIEIFFGSWCPVCEAWVPKFLKSLQQAGNSKIQYSLIGVSRDFSSDQSLAKAKGIRGLPTFIIRQNGIEVGRLVGAPESGTLESALAGMLKNRS